MSDIGTDTMKKIDDLISRYAPIDMATGDHCKDPMTVDLRNIRHYAFSLLCDIRNIEKKHEQLVDSMISVIKNRK